MTQKDILIVGQGMAGSTLASILWKRGYRLDVISSSSIPGASAVAGGLMNPITGQRIVKTWMAEFVFPFAFDFYKKLEEELQTHFFYPKPIYKLFNSIEEQNEWEESPFTQTIDDHSNLSHFVKNPYLGFFTKLSGHVEVPIFIEAVKKKLLQIDAYRDERFDEMSLEFLDNNIGYKDRIYRQVVLCHGLSLSTSSLFPEIPLVPSKGEVLRVEMEKMTEEYIFSKGVFLLPLPEKNSFRCGSTYVWNFENELPTEEGKHEICQKLDSFLLRPYIVREQIAGVRPASRDRKPILGAHESHANLFVFNGLGAKGVSLAPYFATMLADTMNGSTGLLKEVDIKRFSKKAKNR